MKVRKSWFLLPENPSEELLTAEEWRTLADIFSLTARELEVARLIFAGRTRAVIGRRLKRSSGGIRKRIDKLFKKTNVKDKLGLIQRLWHVHRALGDRTPPKGTKMPLGGSV